MPLRRRGPLLYESSKLLRTGHIRLLTLHPGTQGSRIECRLQPIGLSANPVYDALSYVWGDASTSTSDTTITVNGQEMAIRRNLWHALQHLRKPLGERVLWVDAICINQKDDKEKAMQVQQMGTVYARASTVVIWLGLANKDSKASLEFLHEVAQDPAIKDEAIASALFPTDRVWGGPNSMDLVDASFTLSGALMNTLRGREYWYRLWILQEVVLGTNNVVLHIGHDNLSWDDFNKSILRLRLYLGSVPRKPGAPGFRNVSSLRIAIETGTAARLYDIRLMRKDAPTPSPKVTELGLGNPLRSILGLAQISECQEIRDKIYGLLGMATIGMPVNYNLDLFSLFTETLYHFKDALCSTLGNAHEIYTARLSQLLQRLLKGPLLPKKRRYKLHCVGMSGILAGEVVHVLDTGPAVSRQCPDATDESISRAERLTYALEYDLGEALKWFERKHGFELAPLTDSMVSHFSSCPKQHIVFPSMPHYFHATKRPFDAEFIRKLPQQVFRRGSVPMITQRSQSSPQRLVPRLFIASKQVHPQHLCQDRREGSHSVLGYVCQAAEIGDHIVRFLETDVCIVVRSSGAGEYRYVGCALIPMPGDTSTDLQVYEGAYHVDHCSIDGSAPSYEQFQRALQGGDRIDIVMDTETLQFITCFKMGS
jgi:hypothetical protein